MTRRLSIRIIGIVLLAIIVPFSVVTAAPNSNDFTKLTLKNGITLKYKVIKGQPVVSMNAVFPIGMNQEKAKGIAHLLEHLVFRGGSGYTFKDIADVTSRQGGYFNGYTSFNSTAYFYVVPKEGFEAAFKVFNGSLWQTELSEEIVALERKIVVHELDMDYAERLPYYPVYKYFFPELGYTKESVSAITVADLKEFHTSFYQPEKATYIIAGDFEPDQVIQELEKIENKYGRKETYLPEVNEFALPNQDIMEAINLAPYQYQILMAYELDNLTTEDRMILSLLSFIYGTDYKIDYKQNKFKTYNIISRTIGSKDFFGIYYLGRDELYSEEAVAVEKKKIAKFFREFRKVDFKKELTNFIKAIELEWLSSRESASAAAEYELWREMSSDVITIDNLPTLKKLSARDLQRVLDKYFSQPPKTWIIFKNAQPGGSGK